MVMQLEHDGFINNIDDYPSRFAVDSGYSSWFESFVTNYYNDTHRPYTAKSYMDYGNRIKMLWDERPNRPLKDSFPKIIIGKTI